MRVEVLCHGDEVGKSIKTEAELEVHGVGLGGEGKSQVVRVRVPTKVDVEAFWKVILDSVDRADGRYTWPDAAVVEA